MENIPGYWYWDLSAIESLKITDNVVELMISKLRKLPESTQTVSKLAACIGPQFDLNTLASISETSALSVFANLKSAIESGLILSCSELDEQLLIQEYKFGHDRIQQAAYLLMTEERKKAIHLQIGRILLKNTALECQSEKVFVIVDHLNLGQKLINDLEEREHLAQLNLLAGTQAISATAYTAGLNYLQVGIQLLTENCWETQYDLTLALYSPVTEASYLNGNYQQMEERVVFFQLVILLRLLYYLY